MTSEGTTLVPIRPSTPYVIPTTCREACVAGGKSGRGQQVTSVISKHRIRWFDLVWFGFGFSAAFGIGPSGRVGAMDGMEWNGGAVMFR